MRAPRMWRCPSEEVNQRDQWRTFRIDRMLTCHALTTPDDALLIALARPDATRVAGFRTWRAPGRGVKKGEKGIAAIVPHRGTVGEAGESEAIYTVRGFDIGNVFDISQTEGAPPLGANIVDA